MEIKSIISGAVMGLLCNTQPEPKVPAIFAHDHYVIYNHNDDSNKIGSLTRDELAYMMIMHGVISNDSLVSEGIIRRTNQIYSVYKERAMFK